MAKLSLVKASTDVTIYVFIQDSSSTTGAGLTGLVYNSSGLVCYYVRPLAAAAALTLATQTVTGAHSDGGFVEVSSANMPGWYRLDLSDAVCATGVNFVGLTLKGATNMAPVNLEIQLTSINLNDAVRGGMTALPNANADAAGGLIISDAGGLDADAMRSDVAAILVDTGTTLQAELDGIQADTEDIQSRLPAALVGGRIDANMGAISADSVAADNAEAFFDGTGYAGTNNVIPTVTTVSAVTTVNGLANNVITAAATATDFGTEIFNAVMTSQLTESYNTDGTAPTAAQALFLIMQMLTERSVSSTTLTVKRLDGSTTAATFTLDSASAPTSVTRTT